MTAPLTNLSPMTRTKPMEVTVIGRIDNVRRHDGKAYTRLLTPAADAYSKPQVLSIRSKNKLGSQGDEVTVTCLLGGYQKKAFRYVDKDSGETEMITPVDMTLDLIE